MHLLPEIPAENIDDGVSEALSVTPGDRMPWAGISIET